MSAVTTSRTAPGATGALGAAAGLATAETVALVALVLVRGGRGTAFVATCLVLKLVFCRGVTRLGAGSFLALLLYEGATVLYALTAPGVPGVLRALFAGSAATVLVLLGRSVSRFPTVGLPRR